MTQKILSAREAAIYINMSESYLAKARSEGNVGNRTPGPVWHKFGRKVGYHINDLDSWIEAHRVERAI